MQHYRFKSTGGTIPAARTHRTVKAWIQGVLGVVGGAGLLAAGSAIVTVAVVSQKAEANEGKITAVQERVRVVETTSIELKTDARWIKDALKKLLDERGLKAPKE